MSKVFLSHKSQEKPYVLKIKKRLDQYLIDSWIDKDEIEGGEHLQETLIPAIKESETVVVFFSERFVTAKWCIEEIETAYRKEKRIIPVILGDAETVKAKGNHTVETILEKYVYILANEYDPDTTADQIAAAIQKNQLVKIKSLELLTIDGVTVQHIQVEHPQDLPDDLLDTWAFDIQKFLASDKNDPKPIKSDLPVAFSGFRPQWLLTHFALPLFNKRDVFVYNFPSKAFICAYSLRDSKLLGKVLKYVM